MVTGIVEELGVVEAIEDQSDAMRLTVRGPQVMSDAAPGDSISVEGCCLTVATREGETFTADVMKETLDKTTLGALRPGARVNLERAATLATRMGGHLVQGHVDAVGVVVDPAPDLRVRIPAELLDDSGEHQDSSLVEPGAPTARGRRISRTSTSGGSPSEVTSSTSNRGAAAIVGTVSPRTAPMPSPSSIGAT